jgi:CelD/BcsL family acetyltransferase involved in cellulose biosynthesis
LRESFYLDLGQGFDSYTSDLRKKSKTRITNLERKKRGLERDIGPLRFELETAQSSAAFQHLLHWKSHQYLDTGTVDVFRYGWVTSLLQKIVSRRGVKFSGMLSTLYAGKRIVAVHAGMRSSTVAHYWFPAFDRDMAPYSPGGILLLQLARALAENGVRRLDLGAGIEEYKSRFGNGSLVVGTGAVDRSKALEIIRSNLSQFRQGIRRAGLGKMLPGAGLLLHNLGRRMLFK